MVYAPTIAAIKDGDTIIFREVFKEYHEKIYFYVFSKCHSTYTAEEITQITFIKCWQYRASLDESLPLLSQLFRIAKTSFIDYLRKEQHQASLIEDNKNAAALTPDVEERLDQTELIKRVKQTIHQMPPVRRKVFELSREEGMSYKEISTEMSLSVKTVENHIHLAIRQLKQLLLCLLLCTLLLFQ